MKHDVDYVYNGHEITIMHDETGYLCDIRSDETDGELIAGFCGYETKEKAMKQAKDYLDGVANKEVLDSFFLTLKADDNTDIPF